MNAVLRPTEIDAAWLSQRLRDAGHDSADVQSFTAADVGTGQVGRCIRYALVHGNDTHADVPGSLVAKFTSDDPTSRETGRVLKTYLTETHFYREIAPLVNIRVPKCYYAAIDAQGLQHIILMQDLAPATQGDQIAGCSARIARQAVLELVGLHGPTWRDERWFDLLGRTEDGPFADTQGLYRGALPTFIERFSHRLASEHQAFIEAIGVAHDCPMFNLRNANFALEHYDYRLDNLMIDDGRDSPSQPPKVTAVDWQSVRVGKPLNDVAYFMGSALEPEVRRSMERDLLAEYHAGLLEGGVRGYSFDDCFMDYRKGVYAGFAVTVIAAAMVEQTERGDDMFATMARRYAQMALDLSADEFLA